MRGRATRTSTFRRFRGRALFPLAKHFLRARPSYDARGHSSSRNLRISRATYCRCRRRRRRGLGRTRNRHSLVFSSSSATGLRSFFASGRGSASRKTLADASADESIGNLSHGQFHEPKSDNEQARNSANRSLYRIDPPLVQLNETLISDCPLCSKLAHAPSDRVCCPSGRTIALC